MPSWNPGKKSTTGFSSIIHQLTFAGYNRKFKPNRTEFDWLSCNPDEVDAYINSPLCGFQCCNLLWHDLFTGMLEISSIEKLSGINKQLSILVTGGAKDPVSAPKGQQSLTKALLKAGLEDVTMKLYPEGRHEMLNELNKQQVIGHLIQWINKKTITFSTAV